MLSLVDYAFTLILISVITEKSQQQCICNVRLVDEYCGVDLESRGQNGTDCGRNMYFCGKSNMKKEAVLLKTCKPEYECDVKLNGGSACWQSIKCQCTREMKRRGKYCGSQLVGPDCAKNVIYKCPMIVRYSPTPTDGCLNGCENGKCID